MRSSPASAGRSKVFLRRRLGVGAGIAVLLFVAIQFLPKTLHGTDQIAAVLGKIRARSDQKSAPFDGRLLVYGRHALTPVQVRALRTAVSGSVTAVHGGEIAVASGRRDYPQVPIQAFTVDASSYAAAAGAPALSRELSSGVVLSRAGAALRKATVGSHLTLAGGRRLVVTAVVDDHLLSGYEMATTSTVLGQQAAPSASYLLVTRGSNATTTARKLREALPGIDLRIKSRTKNGFLGSADTVMTQAQIKTKFGEFAVKIDSGGSLRLDSAWRDRWITSTKVPQLGVITCNRAIIGELRAAMEEVTHRGLGKIVHTADFQREGGCWNPRVVRFGAGQISTHTWGIAIDINVDVNPLGATPVQDPRLVDIMARHGFTWGGLWLRPDGAHFEWRGTAAP